MRQTASETVSASGNEQLAQFTTERQPAAGSGIFKNQL
jgi:hypothetical protein